MKRRVKYLQCVCVGAMRAVRMNATRVNTVRAGATNQIKLGGVQKGLIS